MKNLSWKIVLSFVMGLTMFLLMAASTPAILEVLKLQLGLYSDNIWSLSGETHIQTAKIATKTYVQDELQNFTAPVAWNNIIAGTKTKISYDTRGLVTSGTDATTADIADSTDKRYCSDAQKTVIGNTSGANTGDDKLKESSGPTTLSVGSIADGTWLKRSGNNVVGDTPAGAGDVQGPATNTDNKIPQWNGANTKILKDGLSLGTTANCLVQLDGSAKLPAVDGSQLINLPGTGTVENIYIDAGAMIPGTTNGATAGTLETSSNKNCIDYMEFAAGAAKSVYFKISVPAGWDHGTIKAKFYWMISGTAGTGNVVWYMRGAALGDNDGAFDCTFGTVQSATDTYASSANIHISPATSAITIANTPAADDMLFFQLYRGDADSYTQAARLIGVAIQYTKATATAW